MKYTHLKREVIIERAKLLHGNKFDYSLVKDTTTNQEIDIICPVHGLFTQKLGTHLTGRGCRYCYYERGEKLIDKYPEIYAQLDQKESKLPDTLSAFTNLSINSNHVLFWKCPKNHSYKMAVSDRVRGRGCPYCSNRKTLPGFNTLADLHPNIASEWDYEKNFPLTPKDVLPKSGKKVWWQCKQRHQWKTTILNRVKDGTGCPYCSGNRAIVGENDLKTKYPEIAKEWDNDKNLYSASEILPNHNKKCWWICPNGHSYSMTPNSRISGGSGCPHCKMSVGEQQIAKILKTYNIHYKPQGSFPDCKDRLPLKFDFLIYDDQNNWVGAIEFNGKQHYTEIDFFTQPELSPQKALDLLNKHDGMKVEYCLRNLKPLLIIPYKSCYELGTEGLTIRFLRNLGLIPPDTKIEEETSIYLQENFD